MPYLPRHLDGTAALVAAYMNAIEALNYQRERV